MLQRQSVTNLLSIVTRGRQFRPLLNLGPAPYHTSAAAGISTHNHFSPANRASAPNRIRVMVAVIDFFVFALILVSRSSKIRNLAYPYIFS
jgi:hypothetical protein